MSDLQIRFLPVKLAGDKYFLEPGLACLPAALGQQIGARGQDVGNAVAQVDAAVMVKINAAFVIVLGLKLHLADLARPGADHFMRCQIAALNDAESVDELGPEFVWPAAVIS